jgi:fluoroacetyl-CoA thioesterase
MKDSLRSGLTFEFSYQVSEDKTVPFLYPDIPEGQVMPKVLATGFMVGLIEFACVKAINSHLDWPHEQTVGTRIDVSHIAATPPGMTVTIKGRLEEVDGRKLRFSVAGYDEIDKISEGIHERVIIDAARFNASIEKKASKFHGGSAS